jgi:Concanavalin A-like lectin/glucanases superfamily
MTRRRRSCSFNPLGVSGLKLWLDATTTPTGAVASWTDKSGNGNNALQASGANQPTNTASQINGKPALIFTDSSYMSIASNAGLSWTGNVTIFFAGDTSTVGSGARRFLSKVSAIGIGKGAISSEARLTTFGVQDYDSTTGFFAVNTPLIACYALGQYPVSFYKNGALINTVGGGIPANTSASDLLVSSVGEPWNGKMGEVLIYNRALSAAEITSVTNYLRTKWGI